MSSTDYGVQVVKVKVEPRFPARVTVDAGLGLATSNGVYTFSFDFSTLTPVGAVGDASENWVAVWDEGENQYKRVAVLDIGEASAGALPGLGYVVEAADASLPNANVLTSTATVVADFATAGQARLNAVEMTGDSGAGGAAGIVPAPAVGSAAANAFLKADGLWTTPAGFDPTTLALAGLDATPGVVYEEALDTFTKRAFTNSATVIWDLSVPLQIKANAIGAAPPPNSVDNLTLADMPASTIKGRDAGGPGDPQDLTPAQAKTILALENVNNTSDANKPVSTATQAALDAQAAAIALKANIASPVFTGDPQAPTATFGDNDTSIATTAFVASAISFLSGTKQPLDSDLTAIANLATTGVIARTGAGAVATRTITATLPISVANGDGVAGNPLLSLATAVGRIIGIYAGGASSTYVPTTGTRSAIVIITGAGGGGGGAATVDGAPGGGGGAGSTTISFIDNPASQAFTIGAGGAGGLSTGATGSNGGTTDFGSLTAPGGLGGQGRATLTAAAGGQGAVGSSHVAINGGDGTSAMGLNPPIGGKGADSFWGGGGLGQTSSGSVRPGRTYGGGGGGAARVAGVNNVGGAGATGFVMVIEFG